MRNIVWEKPIFLVMAYKKTKNLLQIGVVRLPNRVKQMRNVFWGDVMHSVTVSLKMLKKQLGGSRKPRNREMQKHNSI